MKRELKLAAAAVLSGLCFTGPAQAAAYIKFDGVDGESSARGHEKWIEISNFSQPVGLSTSASTRRRGAVVLEDIVCVMALDKASPKLAEAVCTGRVFPSVAIHLTQPSETGAERVYYKLNLMNVSVLKHGVVFSAGGRPGEPEAVGEVVLRYEGVQGTYLTPDGSCPPGGPPCPDLEESYSCGPP